MSDSIEPHTPIALILAAGVGRRMSADRPKQLLSLNGRPVFVHTVERHVEQGHHVILVAGADIRSTLADQLDLHLADAVVDIVTGGETRRDSFHAGVTRIPPTTAPGTGVIVQNAASPNTQQELVARCMSRLVEFGAVQAYHPAQLTMFAHRSGVLDRIIPREDVAFTADPTVYRRDLIDAIAGEMRASHGLQSSSNDAQESTTIDIALRLGARIAVVESPPSNMKITIPGDLKRVERAMTHRSR